MGLYRQELITCPHCDGPSGSRVDHLYHDALPRSFGPWSCALCKRRFRGVVRAPSEVDVLAIEGVPEFSRQMVLLKYEAEGRRTFFVIDHDRFNENGVRSSDEENADRVAYFFEEHSCPTNWLRECVCVIEDGDDDPHGFLEFVRAVDVPTNFDRYKNGVWLNLFPEAFDAGKDIEGTAGAAPAMALPSLKIE